MINIIREAEVPKSLNNPLIKAYLDALADYDPSSETKAPERPVDYRTADVLDAFDRCFYSKCYLTEEKYVNSYAMDIEHFIPKAKQPELTYEWTNLLPASPTANQIKPRINPNGGYLDPSNPNHDVEKRLVHVFEPLDTTIGFSALCSNDLAAVNTANLLDAVHNGHDSNSTKRTAQLRHAIKKRYDEIVVCIVHWNGYKASGNQIDATKQEVLIRKFLSRKSSFVRWSTRSGQV
jgi:hypothetical protein